MLEETLIEWRDKVEREAHRKARREVLREGRQEGRREGRREGQIAAMRQMLLEQMTLRFGRLPATVRQQLQEISSLQELRKLGRRVVRAQSLEEMGLG